MRTCRPQERGERSQRWQRRSRCLRPARRSGVSGDVVRASTFASATTGWAAVRADTPPISCLLRTEDAGTTWTCQLAWSGDVLGRLHAFDGHRASLLLGLRSGFRNEINGLPVAAGEPFYHFVAGTQDAGAT